MITDFLVNGFYHTNDKSTLLILERLDYNWSTADGYKVASFSHVNVDILDYIQHQLGESYVSQVCNNYKQGSIDVVNGVDKETTVWHNDAVEGDHIAILCYLSNINESTGGYTEFRNSQTKEITGKFYPKKFDLCMINHSEGWQHRVEPLKKKVDRIVVNFGYKIC